MSRELRIRIMMSFVVIMSVMPAHNASAAVGKCSIKYSKKDGKVCLPGKAKGTLTWQKMPKLGQPCIRAGITFETLVCAGTVKNLKWNRNPKSQNSSDAPITAVRLDAGFNSTCGIRSSGALACWGKMNSKASSVLGLESGVIAVTVGDGHACAIVTGGVAKCWGANNFGQLGVGTNTSSEAAPKTVIGLESGVIAISAGKNHTCAVLSTNQIKCWGDNGAGQLGDGSIGGFRNRPTVVDALGSTAINVTTGNYYSCAALKTGAAKCWGSNLNGTLGNGTKRDSALPVAVNGLTYGVESVAAGYDHVCALLVSGAVRCWGNNASRQIFTDPNPNSTTPVVFTEPQSMMGMSSGVKTIAVGNGHTCALYSSGLVSCIGSNIDGAIGDGSIITAKNPTPVTGLSSGVSAITTGYGHSCALKSENFLCWGLNDYGQVGDGSKTARKTPAAVIGM